MALFSVLTDDFNDNSFDRTKWYDYGSLTETGGQIKASTTAGSTDYSGFGTINSYSLLASYVQIEVTATGNLALANYEVLPIQVYRNSNNMVLFTIAGSTLYAQKIVSGVTTNIHSAAHNPTNHRFLRIEESGGTTYFKTSADGSTWSTFTSTANPITLTGCYFEAACGTYAAEASSTFATFDNFNTSAVLYADPTSSSMSFSSSSTAPTQHVYPAAVSTSMIFGGSADTAVERIEYSPVRKIVESVRVAWKKDFDPASGVFTIGTSAIGGSDSIFQVGSVVNFWNRYLYEDESQYVTQLEYERSFNMPIGGLTKTIGDIEFDNTSGRFTPYFMGGTSAIFTAVNESRRPVQISAGFNYEGIDQLNSQVVGITTKPPVINSRAKTAQFHFSDFMDYLQNRYVDNTTMFTGIRSDVAIGNFLSMMGFSTAQYDLDVGINTIPFIIAEKGAKFATIINEIVEAENANFFQDEDGVIRFHNRQHPTVEPYNFVQRNITTAMVIDQTTQTDDHIINAVEVRSSPRSKSALRTIYTQYSPIYLDRGLNEVFIAFDNPVLSANTPSGIVANTRQDGSGTNITSSVSINKAYVFAQTAKYTINNTSGSSGYITAMTITGRDAPVQQEIYYRQTDNSSLTAYEERPFVIENNYIQDLTWARSYTQIVLDDFSQPENVQYLTIRAMPALKLGYLVSWQGIDWRIFSIKTRINAFDGFVQEIGIVKRELRTYFVIGLSQIGGSDRIAS